MDHMGKYHMKIFNLRRKITKSEVYFPWGNSVYFVKGFCFGLEKHMEQHFADFPATKSAAKRWESD